MSSYETVELLLFVIGGLLVAAVVATLIRAFYHAWSGRVLTTSLAAARRSLVVAVNDPERADLRSFFALSFRIRVRALVELARGVTGTQLRHARAIAHEAGVVAAAEKMVDSRHWWKRLYGARILTLLGPESSRINPLFYDPHPLVRAQAAEWATTRHDAERIDALVMLVFDEVAFCRFSATDALLRIGTPAVPALVHRLNDLAGLITIPLLEIAAGLGSPAFLDHAVRLASAYEPEVRARAGRVLGSIGGEKAIRTLMQLLGDPDAAVIAAAAESLGHLEHWKAAGRLGDLLAHEDSGVRSAGAHALRALGAPGELMLRKALREGSEASAAIARQALDQPYLGGVA